MRAGKALIPRECDGFQDGSRGFHYIGNERGGGVFRFAMRIARRKHEIGGERRHGKQKL